MPIFEYKAIDAANKVIDQMPEARFYIVGTGDNMDDYVFDERKKGNFVIVNRRVSMSEAAHFYSKASFLVLPYLEATQSGVIPVAYAFGKPVIATSVGSIPEVVVDGQTGFLVPPGDADVLVEKIVLLLSDPSLRKAMGQKAQDFAQQILSWSEIANKTNDLYKEISLKGS